MTRIRAWARIATDRSVVRRALVTAIAVGLLLTAINHEDDLLHGRWDAGLLVQVVLTLLVPYVVSTVSSVAAIEGQRRGHRREYLLLEREVEAINKFPDQNPNPVLRVGPDGRLLYANSSSAPIRAAFRVEVGDLLPSSIFRNLADASEASPARSVEVQSGLRTFAVLVVAVPEFGFLNLYGTDITAAKVIDKFPDRNPNPVMRMSEDGALLYANAASRPIVVALGLEVGARLPAGPLAELRRALDRTGPESVEIEGEGRAYALRPVLIPEFGFTNIYGTDVTASRAITKFPDQNPNPVLRVSREGQLLYANPASALVKRAFGVEVGEQLPPTLIGRIRAIVDADSRETIELESDGHLYALLVVSVFEFGFINIYGTDITAAREIEKAHAENERLLLSILPASIAKRLREGELVIADRFDEMTVLFADIVGFTQLSQRLSASEVVDLLNTIFSRFDRLADRYGLEKVKTIGDAYMVVGGLAPGVVDHAERVAAMGLDMIDEVARFGRERGEPLEIRVGMHTGAAVAGVIGIKKFIYDVWGDTVNTASRMESQGVPGRIQVTESTYERLKGLFVCEARGTVEIKGKGALATYLLADRALAEPTPSG